MGSINTIFKNFQGKKIIVLGDVMVDTYIEGKVTRISPEAPVPVVNFKSRTSRLGGAANVALNLKSLGAEPIIYTIIGKDEEAEHFLKLINEAQLSARGIIQNDERITTVKTRVIGNNQQLVRVDHEKTDPISSSSEFTLINEIKDYCSKEDVAAIIFQDYNKGVLTPGLIEEIVKYANEEGIITTVDPKKENFFSYKDVTLFKPNLKELSEGTQVTIDLNEKDTFLEAVKVINKELNPKFTFVTMSEHGVYINEASKNHFIPAYPRLIADVSGAGDTVISVATLCLASGLDPKTIATLANLAGGLVCEKVGVVSIDKDELLKEAKDKI
ncbi:bifunctional ADP-heptose synthase [Paracrocinitomix mangrovi]|uniref:bifunctional heptose 7-phosphate kinase/heptose 1-phosphate adenyltransferase n=1 Tax=Paracrocinitomix mangrovi TaxID=2862509 RepID=UPI001C8D0046|nr:bifunctional ADP-heptose synthase [Paracrocinitomix mangrovi]UKN02836.1 bifunctional ADP-heptose synthase [Paracrocinitomix mangrovi]